MSITNRLRRWAASLKRDLLALYLAGRDPRVPWYAKLLAMATAAYAFSPIDLIPDFIPVIGYLDDLLLVPALLALAIALIPDDVMAELRVTASRQLVEEPTSRLAAAFVILAWILLAVLIATWLLDRS